MAVQKVRNTAAFDQRQKWLVCKSKMEALVSGHLRDVKKVSVTETGRLQEC